MIPGSIAVPTDVSVRATSTVWSNKPSPSSAGST